jgi:hypothetical protein
MIQTRRLDRSPKLPQKLTVAMPTAKSIHQMAYTRSQISASIASAAQGLLALRFRRPAFVETQPTQASSPRAATSKSSSGPSQTKFWDQWATWYHAFLAEVTDEYPSLPVAERRSQATSRWVSFTAKQLRCSEPQVRAWLRTADQKDLVAAYA